MKTAKGVVALGALLAYMLTFVTILSGFMAACLMGYEMVLISANTYPPCVEFVQNYFILTLVVSLVTAPIGMGGFITLVFIE